MIHSGETIHTIFLAGGDLNDDGCINLDDLDFLLAYYDRRNTSAADITGDGITDISDLAILTGNFDNNCLPDSEIDPSPTPETPTLEPTATSTATPTFDITPTPTAPSVIQLPFIDSLDSSTGYSTSGSWRFDTTTPYQGSGWFADATWRDQTSLLELNYLIDLSGTGEPQLSFWQRGHLATADQITVDISLDGGLSWFPINQQPALLTDWQLRSITLAPYRGQIIRMRFRMETVGQPDEGEAELGYWLDELHFDLLTLPTPTPTESIETPIVTLISTPVEPTATAVISETVTPTPTLTPATLPFIETFDSDMGWLAGEIWRIDTQNAYNGASWFADSALRSQNGILEYERPVDLAGTLHPALSFWHQAALASDDIVTVEISFDDGVTWLGIFQASGLNSEWTQQTIDLSGFQNQLLRLRFHIQTGQPLPEGTVSTGYWLDELTLYDIGTPTETAVPTITPENSLTPTLPVTETVSPAPTVTPTETPTLTATETMPPTFTPPPTATEIVPPSPTVTPTETPTLSLTDTPPPDIQIESPVPPGVQETASTPDA